MNEFTWKVHQSKRYATVVYTRFKRVSRPISLAFYRYEKRCGWTYLAVVAPDHDQVALAAGDLTELVRVLLARHPGVLLGVVRLGLVRTFHLQRDEQVLGWVGIGSLIFARHARHVG